MTLVYAAYAPNAPFLIDPSAFGGVGAASAGSLRDLRVRERYRPDVIVVSSPHWLTPTTLRVNASARPRQIFDFSGFPPSLSEVQYAPKGDPDLARRLVATGRHDGIPADATEEWGLDHGAWAALLHFAPGAEVPVVPMSITTDNPSLHVRWGAAIRTVLEEPGRRAVFLATGSIVHNFARFDPNPEASWPEGAAIEREILERVLNHDVEGLAHFDRRKWRLVQPEGDLSPLFTLLGVVGDGVQARTVANESVFGGVSLTTVEFVPT